MNILRSIEKKSRKDLKRDELMQLQLQQRVLAKKEKKLKAVKSIAAFAKLFVGLEKKG